MTLWTPRQPHVIVICFSRYGHDFCGVSRHCLTVLGRRGQSERCKSRVGEVEGRRRAALKEANALLVAKHAVNRSGERMSALWMLRSVKVSFWLKC